MFGPHLSATLAALILSIMMTCLLLYTVVLRLIPRLEEGLFTISTSRGPEACCTASERKDADDEGMELHAGALSSCQAFKSLQQITRNENKKM